MLLSAVVLTKNEEENISRCLKSLLFCDEVIIIDDYSDDKTLDQISHIKNQNDKSKIKIYQRKLNGNFAEQRNFGLEMARGEWVLFVDADEEITPELAEEIRREMGLIRPRGQIRLRGLEEPVAYYLKRRDFFWGREVRFGEVGWIRRIGLIRLIRKNQGRWTGKVHEELKVKSQKLKVKRFKNFINHYPHQSIKKFLEEVNFYSTLRANELYFQNKRTNVFEIVFYPLGKFVVNYFFRLGFFDGAVGFVYALIMSFHSFLVRAKLYLLIKKIRA